MSEVITLTDILVYKFNYNLTHKLITHIHLNSNQHENTHIYPFPVPVPIPIMLAPAHTNANPKITAAIADSIPGVYNLGLSLARLGAALEPWPVGAWSDPA